MWKRFRKLAPNASSKATDAYKSVSKNLPDTKKGRQTRGRGGTSNPEPSYTKRQLQSISSQCMSNKSTCAKYAGATLLAGYVATNFAENTVQQRGCITECLPPNWREHKTSDALPEYYDDSEVSDGEIKCTGGDCEAYCDAKCKAEHPTTVVGAALETVSEVADVIGIPSVRSLTSIIPSEVFLGLAVYALYKFYVAATRKTRQRSFQIQTAQPLYRPNNPFANATAKPVNW